MNLCRFFYPNLKFANHLHTPAALAIAFKKKIPAIVLIRQPSEAVPSNAYRKKHMQKADISDHLLDVLIDDYICYYEYVLRHASFLSLVMFAELKVDPLNVLQKEVSHHSKRCALRYPISDESLRYFNGAMKAREKKKPVGASSLPDDRSRDEKVAYSELVMSRPMFAQAADLYERMVALKEPRVSE